MQPNLVPPWTLLPPLCTKLKALDNALVFYDNFHSLTKRKKQQEHEETQPIFEGSYIGNV